MKRRGHVPLDHCSLMARVGIVALPKAAIINYLFIVLAYVSHTLVRGLKLKLLRGPNEDL